MDMFNDTQFNTHINREKEMLCYGQEADQFPFQCQCTMSWGPLQSTRSQHQRYGSLHKQIKLSTTLVDIYRACTNICMTVCVLRSEPEVYT